MSADTESSPESVQTPELPAGEPHPHVEQLVAVLAHLRAPGGCAWDAEQTHESLTPYLIEESHELVDAIENGSRDDLLEELGDVLYQVLFHADIAAAHPTEPFTLDDIAARTTAKMVGRHPHVFGEVVADTADEVSANWETWKAQEKPSRTSVLDGVPPSLPALARAQKVLGRAERLGVETSMPGTDVAARDERGIGLALLTLAAEARHAGIDAEQALRSAVRGVEHQIRAAENSSVVD